MVKGMYKHTVCLKEGTWLSSRSKVYIHTVSDFCSCGADLKELFSAPTVQHFLNCVPMREANSHKAIYQHSTVRKVYHSNVKSNSQLLMGP